MADVSGFLIVLSWVGLVIMPIVLVISFVKKMKRLGGLI